MQVIHEVHKKLLEYLTFLSIDKNICGIPCVFIFGKNMVKNRSRIFQQKYVLFGIITHLNRLVHWLINFSICFLTDWRFPAKRPASQSFIIYPSVSTLLPFFSRTNQPNWSLKKLELDFRDTSTRHYAFKIYRTSLLTFDSFKPLEFFLYIVESCFINRLIKAVEDIDPELDEEIDEYFNEMNKKRQHEDNDDDNNECTTSKTKNKKKWLKFIEQYKFIQFNQAKIYMSYP